MLSLRCQSEHKILLKRKDPFDPALEKILSAAASALFLTSSSQADLDAKVSIMQLIFQRLGKPLHLRWRETAKYCSCFFMVDIT